MRFSFVSFLIFVASILAVAIFVLIGLLFYQSNNLGRQTSPLMQQEVVLQATHVPPSSPALPTLSLETAVPSSISIPTSQTIATPIPASTATATHTPSPTPTATNSSAPYGYATTIGKSHQNREILSYQFKNGPNKVIFVGGIHGGYEWNSILLTYELIDYFTVHPESIPDSVTLYIIPTLNPDGQYRITQKEGRFQADDVIEGDTFPGRFNAAGVDLNRNWDCDWSEDAVWRNQPVNPGQAAFSEPETQALRDYIFETEPLAVIFWHSAADGVYAARCPELYQPSLELAYVYGNAANYPVHEYFTSYAINGDASDWLVTQGIPSITVELKTAKRTDWSQNLAGTLAILTHFAQSPEP